MSDPTSVLGGRDTKADFILLPRPLRVLVVDDNRDAADTLAAVLQMSGAVAEACYDGPAAVAVAQWFRPDVCLIDLAMPGMDGDELAIRLHDQVGTDRMLLVAVTARADDEARRRTRSAGFHLHMVKPVDPLDLLAALADADWWLDRPGA
jgi:CheY-like chemotaxis protein